MTDVGGFLEYLLAGEDPQEDAGERDELLAAINGDLIFLLELPHARFWSQVVFDSSVIQCVDSCLRLLPRPHQEAAYTRARAGRQELQLYRNLFLVLLRLSTHKESQTDFISKEAYGIIIYDNWLLDVPRLFDLCVLYIGSNGDLVRRMVENVFACQPAYYRDLETSAQAVASVLDLTLAQCGTLARQPVAQPEKWRAEALDLQQYVLDIAVTLEAFLVAFTPAGDVYVLHELPERLARLYQALNEGVRPGWTTDVTGLALLARANAALVGLGIALFAALQSSLDAFVQPMLPVTPLFFKDVLRLHPSWAAHMPSAAGVLVELSDEAASRARQQQKPLQEQQGAASSAESKVLATSIQTINDIFPDLGAGFIAACLDAYGDSVEVTMNHLLQGSLATPLLELDRAMLLVAAPANAEASMVPVAGPSVLTGRHNIHDGDDFDVFAGRTVSLGKAHVGKREDANDTRSLLNDKDIVNTWRENYIDMQYEVWPCPIYIRTRVFLKSVALVAWDYEPRVRLFLSRMNTTTPTMTWAKSRCRSRFRATA